MTLRKLNPKIWNLCAGLLLAFSFAACTYEEYTLTIKDAEEETEEFTENKVFIRSSGDLTEDTARIRLYKGNKYVAYMGMNTALATLAKLNVVSTSYADGIYSYKLKNSDGIQFVINVNPGKGTVYCAGFYEIFSTSKSDIAQAASSTDTSRNYPFVAISSTTNVTPYTFDLAKYGMKMYAGSDDAYLPLAALCAIFYPAGNYLTWNGVDLIKGTESSISDFKDWRMKDERQSELIDYNYNMLCFIHDYCYGHPGYYGLFDEDNDGFNLKDEETRTAEADKLDFDTLLKNHAKDVYEGLHSASYSTYIASLYKLTKYVYGDVHTGMKIPSMPVGSEIDTTAARKVTVSGKYKVSDKCDETLNDIIDAPKRDVLAKKAYEEGRLILNPGDAYVTNFSGLPIRYVSFDTATNPTTAVLHFDSFEAINDAAWKKEYPKWIYYNEQTDAEKALIDAATADSDSTRYAQKPSYPNDDLGFFYYAFNQIENKYPTVKNVVIDISVNGGGAVADVGFLLNFICSGYYEGSGEDEDSVSQDVWLTDQDVHAGSSIKTMYFLDLNLDGKINALDTEVCAARRKKYSIAILTTGCSFSCANLFPVMAKDFGIKIIGQRSLGGSCDVVPFVTVDGFIYRYSVARRGVPADGKYTTMENGAAVDKEINYGTGTDAEIAAFYKEASLGAAAAEVDKK